MEQSLSCWPACSSSPPLVRLRQGLEAWSVAAPIARKFQTAWLLLVLVVSADADPSISRIIIQFHSLDALVLMLVLRRLMLGGEEGFFSDLDVLVLMMMERRCSS